MTFSRQCLTFKMKFSAYIFTLMKLKGHNPLEITGGCHILFYFMRVEFLSLFLYKNLYFASPNLYHTSFSSQKPNFYVYKYFFLKN